jgi:hypothetical protein
MKTKLAGIQ